MPTRTDPIELLGRGGPNPLRFFTVYLLTGIGMWVAIRGGAYTLFGPMAMTFVAVPLFDGLLGVDTRNPPDWTPSPLRRNMFRLATWLALPVQAGVLLWGAQVATSPSASIVEVIGVTVTAGITGGVIGIVVAHELIHRSNRLDRILGNALLVLVCYRHWATEHVAGHHRWVGTPKDPATARIGEALPAFIVRSVVHSFWSAWRIEQRRNARRGIKTPLRNPAFWGLVLSGAVAAVLGVVFGVQAVWFLLAQAALAIGLLETINYIEHYGLERRQVRPGVYERVTPLHSWNASQRLTNVLLFNLQRHSDHHSWPARPYYDLRHHGEAPQLPTGYAGMALLAMVPPLWRRVMDPRVAAHRVRQLSKMVDSECAS
jgi:alkane 1-monooxygenase